MEWVQAQPTPFLRESDAKHANGIGTSCRRNFLQRSGSSTALSFHLVPESVEHERAVPSVIIAGRFEPRLLSFSGLRRVAFYTAPTCLSTHLPAVWMPSKVGDALI
jgi:hypothetical protein